MTTTPIYDALVSEGFDPASVAPISTEAARHQAHTIWAAAAWQRVKAGAVKAPAKKRAVRGKAAS